VKESPGGIEGQTDGNVDDTLVVPGGKTVLVVELVDVNEEVVDAIVLDIVEVEENGVLVLDDS
jgi:hypothetical protein